MHSTIPVSYTHLDVYKRQTQVSVLMSVTLDFAFGGVHGSSGHGGVSPEGLKRSLT